MIPTIDKAPFSELPASLVEEVLDRTGQISRELLESFETLRQSKTELRKQLSDSGLLQRDSSLPWVQIPTSCGIDGSYAVERLLAMDLVATGAVAVEGLTPPSETRHWPEPKHLIYVDTEAHDADTSSILRGIMMGMELQLARHSPHDLVFLDGSLTTPTIFFNQALNKVSTAPHLKIAHYLREKIPTFLEAYITILEARRSDRYWLGVPKYTTRREIGRKLNWPEVYDDRGLLSTVLEPGEYTQPLSLQAPDEPWHIQTVAVQSDTRKAVAALADKATSLLENVRVIYYRPNLWLPALRLEVSHSIAHTPARLGAVLMGIKHQCGPAAIMEPYPLYMADRMVKHLARSVPAFRHIASQHLAETYQGNVDDIFTSLHGYRTESGR
jgi:hypothetical protein